MATDEDVADSVEESTSGGTLDEDYRWKGLSSLVVLSTVVSYNILVLGKAFGYSHDVLTGGTWATFSLAYIACLAYALGPSMVKQAAKAKSGQ